MSDSKPEDDFFEIEFEETDSSNQEEFSRLTQQIEERCKVAKIETTRTEFSFDFEYDLEVHFPSGRETKSRIITTIEDATRLLSVNFENVRFISGYDAYFENDTGNVVGVFQLIAPFRGFADEAHRQRVVGRIFPTNDFTDGKFFVSIKRGEHGHSPEIVCRDLSEKTKAIFSYPLTRNLFEINLINLNALQHDNALHALEAITDALFLQIEAETSAVFNLTRGRRTVASRTLSRRLSKDLQYTYPKVEYNHQAMICYWYAISANQMPLMQFLAYYQSIEFYFPIYSEQTTKKSLQNIIMQPGFRVDRDADVLRLVQILKATGLRGYGSEKSQIYETIKACMQDYELREFISKRPDRKDFLSKSKELKVKRLAIDSSQSDLIRDIADRIYEIRCKIVHTKYSDGNELDEPILPYTNEEKLLEHDIALIKFVCTKVIGASGSAMTLDYF